MSVFFHLMCLIKMGKINDFLIGGIIKKKEFTFKITTFKMHTFVYFIITFPVLVLFMYLCFR